MKKLKKQIIRLLKNNKIINQEYIKFKWREKKLSFGNENTDKYFYVIRRAPEEIGLFSYVLTFLGMIVYALDKGFIPVIDMQNYGNMFLEKDEIGKVNSWEYYFKQPAGYSLKEIQNSRHVILSKAVDLNWFRYPGFSLIYDIDERQRWRLFCKENIVLQQDVIKKRDILVSKLFQGQKVIGVICRGTDYLNLRPKDHPVQPSIEDIIIKTKELMLRNLCERVYLATEDEQIYLKIKKVFGDKLLVNDTRRYLNTYDAKLSEIVKEKGINKRKNGEDYLLNILLLSKCNCLVAGCSGGLYGALLMTEGYEEEYIFDLGLY